MLELSFKTKSRLFNRKMSREGYAARIYKWENKVECMCTHVDRVNSTCGFITLRVKRYNHMGEFNSPIYNVRTSKLIRDTERQLRMFNDPQQQMKILENARLNELREEMKDKWRSLVNRRNVFSQYGVKQ